MIQIKNYFQNKICKTVIFRQYSKLSVKKNLTDVIKLKKLGEAHFINLNSKVFIFSPELTLKKLVSNLKQERPEIFSMKILNENLVPFDQNQLIEDITIDSFYININHIELIYVLKLKSDNYSIKNCFNINEFCLDTVINSFGSNKLKQGTIRNFLNKTIDVLLKEENLTMQSEELVAIIKDRIHEDIIKESKNLKVLKKMRGILKAKKTSLLEIKDNYQNKIKKRNKFFTGILYSGISFQMLFTQYGCYYKYSWDIMEPITCLFTLFDIIIAYSFWLFTNIKFENGFEKDFNKSKNIVNLSKQLSFEEELTDIIEMEKYLNFNPNFEGTSLKEVIESFETQYE